ncbi:MAG: hypothetical protein ACKO0V_04130, partial [bacterium]
MKQESHSDLCGSIWHDEKQFDAKEPARQEFGQETAGQHQAEGFHIGQPVKYRQKYLERKPPQDYIETIFSVGKKSGPRVQNCPS